MWKIFSTVFLFFASTASAVELKPLKILGKEVEDREINRAKAIHFVQWVDDDTLIYAGRSGFIKSYSLRKKLENWSIAIDEEFNKVVVGKEHVFVLGGRYDTIYVFSLTSGVTIRKISSENLAKHLQQQYLFPTNIAWVPGKEKLLLVTLGSQAESMLLIDSKTLALDTKLKGGEYFTQLSANREETHLVSLSNTQIIRVWSIATMQETFKLGEGTGLVIDAPFVSNAAYDGKNTLVFSVDNSWDTGSLHVYDTQAKNELLKCGSLNGHLAMDVDFKASRIALTGTSKGLTLIDLQGRLVTAIPHAAADRILAVKFSPNGNRIALGSMDNTVRIFEIK